MNNENTAKEIDFINSKMLYNNGNKLKSVLHENLKSLSAQVKIKMDEVII